MSGFTLQQIFGPSAEQDADTITIHKAGLAEITGFVPAEQNDGESILVAILLQAAELGLDTDHRDGTEDFNPNPNQQVAINPPTTNLVSRLDSSGLQAFFKRDSFVIDLDVAFGSISPGDY